MCLARFFIYILKISKFISLLSSLILLTVYGCLFFIYILLRKSKIFNKYFNNVDSLDLLPFLPTIVTCDYRFSFFTVSFYGILYRVELLNNHILHDKSLHRLISITFRIMRRSPFFLLRSIGRVGGTGLGNMGFPGGNGPRLYAGVIVALGSISIYQYRKYKVAQVAAQTECAKYDVDIKSRQYDRAWDEYRKDKDAYDRRYPWWKGRPLQHRQRFNTNTIWSISLLRITFLFLGIRVNNSFWVLNLSTRVLNLGTNSFFCLLVMLPLFIVFLALLSYIAYV